MPLPGTGSEDLRQFVRQARLLDLSLDQIRELTGLSVLAVNSLIATAGIAAGGVLAAWMMRESRKDA